MAINIEYGKYLDENARLWEKVEENRPGIFADSRWAWRFEQARKRMAYDRLAEPLAGALDRALTGLENALEDFTWPENSIPFQFRRSTEADPRLDGKLDAQAKKAENADRFYKFFSRGRNADSDSGLDPGTYRFEVKLGDESEKIELDVDSSDTWGDVLGNVATAVNDLKLPVQADVIVQHNPYQKIEDLGKTGSILAFSVEPGREAQNLEIKDTTGLLVYNLDLEETESPVLPADTRKYSLTGISDAEPTALYSRGFSPHADSGVAAGTHKIAYSIGGESGTFDIDVDSGMTWEELLIETADVINSTSDKVEAEVVDVDIFSDTDDGPLYMDGKSISIKAANPKLGERLSLTEYGGPWLESVDEFFDPSGNLPADPNTGDRYASLSTANGWTEDYVYEWDGSTWQETIPVAGNALYAQKEGDDYFYDGTDWSTTPAGGFLEELNLRRPEPGMDAELLVDNDSAKSATGTFAKDKGRLVMDLEDSFGERLPLKVIEGVEKLEEGFSEVVTAFNDLQEFLEPNKDLFREDFVTDWRDAVRDNAVDLSWLGIDEIGDTGILMADMENFWQAVGSDPDRAKQLLVGEEGLFTTWGELAGKARSPDTADSLVPKAYLQDVSAPAAKVFENEKRSALQQVIDSELDTDSPNRTTEMELEILKASAEEKSEVDRLMGDAGLDVTGSIFKRRG